MHIETLENRRLFAATVSEGYPGFYEVHGDYTNDVIEISINQSSETFTLDGATYTSVSYIYVHTYAGDDFITVQSEDGSGPIGASISAGDGSDTVMLFAGGAIWGGNGGDVLYLVDSYTGAVYGEAGDDQLYIGGYSADVEISGGEGNDYIDATGNYGGVSMRGDAGNDTIHGSEYDDQIEGGAGNDLLYGHGGNDIFYARDGESDEMHGGAGIDIAYIDVNGDSMYDIEYEMIG